MKTLYLGIPTMGWVCTELAGWIKYQEGIVPHYTSRIAPVSKARNTIIDAFLSSNKDVLMMVDADTIPPQDAIEKLYALIDSGADMATGITPIIRPGYLGVNVYQTHADVEKPVQFSELPKEPFAIVGAGASCIMMTRDILKRLPKPYCKTIEYDNGAYCSEDLYICDQIYKIGGSMVAHPEVLCGHVKEKILSF